MVVRRVRRGICWGLFVAVLGFLAPTIAAAQTVTVTTQTVTTVGGVTTTTVTTSVVSGTAAAGTPILSLKGTTGMVAFVLVLVLVLAVFFIYFYDLASGKMTHGLVRVLIAFTLLVALLLSLAALIGSSAPDAADLRKTVITSFLAALTTVIGFYFGSRTAGGAPPPGGGPAPPEGGPPPPEGGPPPPEVGPPPPGVSEPMAAPTQPPAAGGPATGEATPPSRSP